MDEYITFQTTARDGRILDMAVVDEFDYDKKHYLVAALIEGDTISDEGRFIFRYHFKGDDFIPEKISDAAEYERISEAYLELCGENGE